METWISFELLPDEITALKAERGNVELLCQEIIRGYVRRQRRKAARWQSRKAFPARRSTHA